MHPENKYGIQFIGQIYNANIKMPYDVIMPYANTTLLDNQSPCCPNQTREFANQISDALTKALYCRSQDSDIAEVETM